MNTKSFLIRFYAIIALSAIAATAVGSVAGIAIFTVIKDRNTQSADWFPNFTEAAVSLLAGLLIAAAFYAYGARQAGKRFLGERYSKGTYLRLLSAPAIWLALIIPNGVVPNLLSIASGGPSFWMSILSAVVIAGVMTLPIGSLRLKLFAVLTAVGIAVVTGVISSQVAETHYEEDTARSFEQWNGPLVLVKGRSTNFAGTGWYSLAVEAPYSNEDYASVTLHDRRKAEDGTEDNATIGMYNTPVASRCLYPSSCTKLADSEFGPVYKSETSNIQLVGVPNGHLEVSGAYYGVDALAVINSLEVVDATTFLTVVEKIED